ncbi:MAG: hypothetical protein JSU63_01790 [Phycisphaerales bacterium]|nr:MAG: hypothetical protein JSU63_01790 [Phycisphaerales bacterium]
MPSTPDRTTVRAAIEELSGKLCTNLATDPPTAAKPFRRVAVGSGGFAEYPRPFLTLMLARAKPVGTTQGDKLIQVGMILRIVTDIADVDPHGPILDTIGALDDYLDSVIDSGVIEGAEGFDDRAWSFDYPESTVGPRVAAATATQSFVVKVEREHNRVPAS